MRALLVAFFVFSVLMACSEGSSGVKEQLDGSDSLVVQFIDTLSGSVTRSTATADPKAISKLIHFIDGETVEEYKCGYSSYNGNLLFFNKGKLNNQVSFNYTNKECKHFLSTINGKLVSTEMSNESADFLQAMAEGKDRY